MVDAQQPQQTTRGDNVFVCVCVCPHGNLLRSKNKNRKMDRQANQEEEQFPVVLGEI